MKYDNWFVITGGPSFGKTTLLGDLDRMGHMTVSEAARNFIDQELKKGFSLEQIRADEMKFQNEVFKMKIEVEKNHKASLQTFFDRGLHDTIAYIEHAGQKVSEDMMKAIERVTYAKVFLLEPLDIFVKDYARTEDMSEAISINKKLEEVYKRHNMELVKVPPLPAKQRLEFVLEQIKC